MNFVLNEATLWQDAKAWLRYQINKLLRSDNPNDKKLGLEAKQKYLQTKAKEQQIKADADKRIERARQEFERKIEQMGLSGEELEKYKLSPEGKLLKRKEKTIEQTAHELFDGTWKSLAHKLYGAVGKDSGYTEDERTDDDHEWEEVKESINENTILTAQNELEKFSELLGQIEKTDEPTARKKLRDELAKTFDNFFAVRFLESIKLRHLIDKIKSSYADKHPQMIQMLTELVAKNKQRAELIQKVTVEEYTYDITDYAGRKRIEQINKELAALRERVREAHYYLSVENPARNKSLDNPRYLAQTKMGIAESCAGMLESVVDSVNLHAEVALFCQSFPLVERISDDDFKKLEVELTNARNYWLVRQPTIKQQIKQVMHNIASYLQKKQGTPELDASDRKRYVLMLNKIFNMSDKLTYVYIKVFVEQDKKFQPDFTSFTDADVATQELILICCHDTVLNLRESLSGAMVLTSVLLYQLAKLSVLTYWLILNGVGYAAEVITAPFKFAYNHLYNTIFWSKEKQVILSPLGEAALTERTSNYHRLRVSETTPNDTWSSIKFKKDGQDMGIIKRAQKVNGKWITRSYAFLAQKWTLESAKAWMSKHKFSIMEIEPATKSMKESIVTPFVLGYLITDVVVNAIKAIRLPSFNYRAPTSAQVLSDFIKFANGLRVKLNSSYQNAAKEMHKAKENKNVSEVRKKVISALLKIERAAQQKLNKYTEKIFSTRSLVDTGINKKDFNYTFNTTTKQIEDYLAKYLKESTNWIPRALTESLFSVKFLDEKVTSEEAKLFKESLIQEYDEQDKALAPEAKKHLASFRESVRQGKPDEAMKKSYLTVMAKRVKNMTEAQAKWEAYCKTHKLAKTLLVPRADDVVATTVQDIENHLKQFVKSYEELDRITINYKDDMDEAIKSTLPKEVIDFFNQYAL